MLRPIEIIILFYSRTRNGTNINFIAVFISMLNSRFLIYKDLSHYSNSASEMFQWKQGVINQRQRVIFPRRFKRKNQRNQEKKKAKGSLIFLPPRSFILFLRHFLSHIHLPFLIWCSCYISFPPETLLFHTKKWLLIREGKSEDERLQT